MKKLITEQNVIKVLALTKFQSLVLFLNIYLHNKASFFFSLLLFSFLLYLLAFVLINSVTLPFSIYCVTTHAKDNITQGILKIHP